MSRERYRLVLLTTKLEIMVLGADSREAARAADLLLRGEDKENSEEKGEDRKYIGSWIIHTQTGEVLEAYGPRCIGIDPGEYGYKRKQSPDALIS